MRDEAGGKDYPVKLPPPPFLNQTSSFFSQRVACGGGYNQGLFYELFNSRLRKVSAHSRRQWNVENSPPLRNFVI